jgi:hypothetical protein
MEPTTNGLNHLMPIANLTVVGALILTIVVCTIFLVTKGIPKAIDGLTTFVDKLMDRNEKRQSDTQSQFISALDRQAVARAETAKAGHDAAMRIADNLHDLTEEIRSVVTSR